MAQQVKNLLAMQEIRVQYPGWEDPLEEGMANHSSILARRILQLSAHTDILGWWEELLPGRSMMEFSAVAGKFYGFMEVLV